MQNRGRNAVVMMVVLLRWFMRRCLGGSSKRQCRALVGAKTVEEADL